MLFATEVTSEFSSSHNLKLQLLDYRNIQQHEKTWCMVCGKRRIVEFFPFAITFVFGQDTMDLCPVWMELKSLEMLVRTINLVYLCMGSSASSMDNMPSVLIKWNSLLGEMLSVTLLLSFMTVKKLLR